MAAHADFTRRLSALFRKTRKTRRDSNRRRFRTQFEVLEQRYEGTKPRFENGLPQVEFEELDN